MSVAAETPDIKGRNNIKVSAVFYYSVFNPAYMSVRCCVVKCVESYRVIECTESAVAYAREEESKKGMDSSQLTGSTSSYARKYALNGLFAIDDTKDSDTTNTHGKDNVTTLSEAQLKRMYAIGYKAGYNDEKINSMVKQRYNKEAKNMTKTEYDNVVDGLEKIIKKNEVGA